MKPHKGTNISIAYADDNIVFRKGISALLENNGNIIVTIQADNGEDLLNKLKAAESLPDVCLIDINMPVFNGFEVTPKIRKQWPALGILAYSSWNDEYNTMQMINKGANGYMVKGYPIEELINALNSVYSNGVFCADATDEQFYNFARKDSDTKIELSAQEKQLLQYFSKFDIPRTEIPELMSVSEEEFEKSKMSIFEKLHVHSRTGLALYAIQTGLIQADLS